MALEADNLYLQALVGLLHAIDNQIPLSQGSYLTICYHLKTERGIVNFVEWVRNNLDGDKLLATEMEIVQAAVQAGRA